MSSEYIPKRHITIFKKKTRLGDEPVAMMTTEVKKGAIGMTLKLPREMLRGIAELQKEQDKKVQELIKKYHQ